MIRFRKSVGAPPSCEPSNTSIAPVGGFIGQICAYFRDFLDTDFRKQRMPKRSIGLRDAKGNLTGISIAKFPELTSDLWRQLGKQLDASRQLSISVGRGKYHSRVNQTLLDVIEKHVSTLEGEVLGLLGDRIKVIGRELLESLRNDPERYRETVITSLRNDLVRTAVAPLTQLLESSIRRAGNDEFEVAYDIEDELGLRLVADAGEAIGSALATAIVEGKFNEFDQVINDVVEPETIRRRLATYFTTFRASDFFQELHELRSTLKIRENFEIYLYVGTLHHNRVGYPLFYIPVQIELQERIFRITADPQIYINKKALEFAAQETAREIERTVPFSIRDRIVYLEEKQSFLGVMQELLDLWCADLALSPPIDLANPLDQKAQRSQLTITNSMHFSAFDKADESLLNDYEELLTNLVAGTEVAIDFQEIVNSFLTTNPIDVNADINREWDGIPIEGRLVFQSPVPLNEEQRKILAALRHKDARFLSIEGPPGTGKSHTITAIVFEAILNGQNVLVLSDKSEALDVVEDKLNEVLNSVRFGDDFQNPILRLGRAGNTYGRILSGQAIEAIRAHHRASTASQQRLTTKIHEDESRLSEAIRATADQGSKIKLNDVYNLHRQEIRVSQIVEDPETLVEDDNILYTLDAAASICRLLADHDDAILRTLRTVYGKVSLHGFELFLRTQAFLSQNAKLSAANLNMMHLFSTFREEHLVKLHALISEYHNARWPVFGYLVSRRRLREIDGKMATELSPVNALNAHTQLAYYEQAHLLFSKLAAEMTRAGMRSEQINLAFQQLIDDLPPLTVEVARTFLQQLAAVRATLNDYPDLMKRVGLEADDISEWTTSAASASSRKLHEVLTYSSGFKTIQDTFRDIPEFDYAGEKTKLESLHAQRLAHTLDGQVVHFADNYRNLSRSLRDIIRKKQQFPKDDFATMQQAFPCMIAGIRDYAEYIPLEKGLFDIVIIDEASQVSIAQAFPAFIRAKRLVVLGDRKQFSNVKTATASTEINNRYANALIDDYRRERDPDVNTLNRLKLFNIKTSVLEFVERIANSQALLRKHFRGYPELISFSSKTFYGGQLQAVKIRGVPIDEVICFTQVHHDGRIEVRKNVNSAEWEEILEELRRLAEFGDEAPSVEIITPFTEQQSYIVQKLNALPDGERLQTKLKLKTMTFDSCQGEERDVIIYSLVATPLQDKLAYIFPKSLDEADEVDHALRLQRLNVGFSRAKERIHFFHSMPLDAYRGAIAQAINHYVGQREIARKRPTFGDTDPNSPMERQVLSWLEQTRFVQMLDEFVEIDAQFELGAYLRQLDPGYQHPAYRVDFLMKVQAQNRVISIVIEYDGFQEHFTDLEKVDAYNHEDYYRPEDVERQKVLEGYGYRFLRINRFNLGRDPVKTLDARLSKLAQEALLDASPHTIIEEVKGTAEGLMSGDKKVCRTCGEVREIEDFKDPELKHRMGRKCMQCKRAEAASKAQRAAGRAEQQAARIAAPVRAIQPRWRQRSRRRW